MSTPQNLQELAASCLAALARDTAAAGAAQCLMDIKAGKYDTKLPDRPLLLDRPKPQPTVHITINNIGE